MSPARRGIVVPGILIWSPTGRSFPPVDIRECARSAPVVRCGRRGQDRVAPDDGRLRSADCVARAELGPVGVRAAARREATAAEEARKCGAEFGAEGAVENEVGGTVDHDE